MCMYVHMRIRYPIFRIFVISHIHTISHILTDFQSSVNPILWSSVWCDPIRTQCRISLLIRTSLSLYNLYGFAVPGVTPTLTPLILYLWRHHIRTCLMRLIAIITINFLFTPTHSCGAIIALWDYTYHTYLGFLKLFYIGLYWDRICTRNHSHDLVFELPEHSTLETFVHVVANHIPCGTPE